MADESLKIEKIIDKKKLGDTIHAVYDIGVELLKKDKLEQSDFGKLKVMRNLGPFVNAGVSMIQQETAMLRVGVVMERMKQLGYTIPKSLAG